MHDLACKLQLRLELDPAIIPALLSVVKLVGWQPICECIVDMTDMTMQQYHCQFDDVLFPTTVCARCRLILLTHVYIQTVTCTVTCDGLQDLRLITW